MYLFIVIISVLFSVAWIWIFSEMNRAIDITEEEEFVLGENSEITSN